MKPFPQFKTGSKDLAELWYEYRHKMISLAGISIIIFGNKKDPSGNVIPADGLMREFAIAVEHNLVPIPIAATGYITQEIYQTIMSDPEKYYKGIDWIIPIIKELADAKLLEKEIIEKVITIIKNINK